MRPLTANGRTAIPQRSCEAARQLFTIRVQSLQHVRQQQLQLLAARSLRHRGRQRHSRGADDSDKLRPEAALRHSRTAARELRPRLQEGVSYGREGCVAAGGGGRRRRCGACAGPAQLEKCRLQARGCSLGRQLHAHTS